MYTLQKYRTNGHVVDAWAKALSEDGQGSTMFFEGDIIYSYGTHFPVARHVRPRAVLYTTESFSTTTDIKHKPLVRRACHDGGYQVFSVPDVLADTPAAHSYNVEDYIDQIKDTMTQAERRRRPDYMSRDLRLAQALVEEARLYAEHFNLDVAHFDTMRRMTVDLRLRRAVAERAAG